MGGDFGAFATGAAEGYTQTLNRIAKQEHEMSMLKHRLTAEKGMADDRMAFDAPLQGAQVAESGARTQKLQRETDLLASPDDARRMTDAEIALKEAMASAEGAQVAESGARTQKLQRETDLLVSPDDARRMTDAEIALKEAMASAEGSRAKVAGIEAEEFASPERRGFRLSRDKQAQEGGNLDVIRKAQQAQLGAEEVSGEARDARSKLRSLSVKSAEQQIDHANWGMRLQQAQADLAKATKESDAQHKTRELDLMVAEMSNAILRNSKDDLEKAYGAIMASDQRHDDMAKSLLAEALREGLPWQDAVSRVKSAVDSYLSVENVLGDPAERLKLGFENQAKIQDAIMRANDSSLSWKDRMSAMYQARDAGSGVLNDVLLRSVTRRTKPPPSADGSEEGAAAPAGTGRTVSGDRNLKRVATSITAERTAPPVEKDVQFADELARRNPRLFSKAWQRYKEVAGVEDKNFERQKGDFYRWMRHIHFEAGDDWFYDLAGTPQPRSSSGWGR